MKLLLALCVAAAFSMTVGMVGTELIWLNSSNVATEQYTHAFGVKSKGESEPRIYYLTDKQVDGYRTFQVLQNYGLGICLGIAGVLWILQRLNKNGGKGA